MRRLARITAFAGLALACGQADGTVEAASQDAIRLRAVPVRREQLVEPILGTGTIAPEKLTNVGPRVDGIVEEIFVHTGVRVSAGDPLFRTREVNYRLRLDQSRAELRLARAEAEKAQRDLERIEELAARGVASTEQLDSTRTQHAIASARVETAGAAVARAEQDLEDTVVRAPYDGVITQKFADEGTFMRTMMTGTAPVIQIMKIDLVVALVNIPAVHLPRVRVGTPGRVHIDGLGRVYETQVHVVNDRIDREARTIDVRLGIRNSDFAIKPGLFARVELLPEPRTVTVVERATVLGREGDRHVFVAIDGRAARRAVHVRDLDATRMEVLDGLEPGERVLSGPDLVRLEEGTRVLIEVADAAR